MIDEELLTKVSEVVVCDPLVVTIVVEFVVLTLKVCLENVLREEFEVVVALKEVEVLVVGSVRIIESIEITVTVPSPKFVTYRL